MSTATGVVREVLRAHRGPLAATWTLYGLELLTGLARPYLLGAAIDGLLRQHPQPFAALVATHLAYLVIGTFRHMVDTRAFSSVYRSFVTRLMTRRGGPATLSQRAALSTLAREVTDFLQYDVNYVVEAFYNIVGALVVMLVYDRWVVLICLAVLVPVTVMARWYGTRATRLNQVQYDELEQQVDVLATEDAEAIHAHYTRLRAAQVELSDLEAVNWGTTELSVLVALAAALWLSTVPASLRLPIGAIVALYSYLLRFASGLETIPYTLQRLGALRDILRRVTRAVSAGDAGSEALRRSDD